MATENDTPVADASPPDASPLDASVQAPSRHKQLSDFEEGKIIFAHNQRWSY